MPLTGKLAARVCSGPKWAKLKKAPRWAALPWGSRWKANRAGRPSSKDASQPYRKSGAPSSSGKVMPSKYGFRGDERRLLIFNLK